MDTSLPGLVARLGEDEKRASWLAPELAAVAKKINEAAESADKDPSSAAEPLSAAVASLSKLVSEVQSSPLSAAERSDLEAHLQEKLGQAQNALNLALNVTLQATVLGPPGSSAGLPREGDALTVISPGQKFAVRVTLHNGSKDALPGATVSLSGISPSAADQEETSGLIPPGKDHVVLFLAQVPADFPYTRPYWHRDNPQEDSLNIIDQPEYAGLPLPPPPFRVRASYAVPDSAARNEISAPVVAPFTNDRGDRQERTLATAPVFSVMLEPGEQVIPTESTAATSVKVAVSCNLTGAPAGTLHLEAPQGWRVEPARLAVDLGRRGASQNFEFKVSPSSLKEGRAQIRAVLEAGGKKFSEGYSIVTRADLRTFYYYQPAQQRVSMVDVKVPKDLKVGYIMGAGDDIPPVLQQVGIDVTLIPPEKLASEDLSRYGTLVLGIRAYDTQKEVAANNKKLLDYVSSGGTLVVQYNAGVADFNAGHFTPYPAELTRQRVSVEDAPVQILDPQDSLFHYPNQITQRDFDGWVQERGLNFMGQWDDHFKPLLACNDPGEPPQKGGLLLAKYGKGTYIYTGYAFFRELPAGVPGAIRLYVNLLSTGH